MIVGCILLASIQPYLWAYNPSTDKCSLRPQAVALWEVWSWATEMLVFLAVPLVILIINVLVMREVWRMSSSGPPAVCSAAEISRGPRVDHEPRQSFVHSSTSAKNAATNAMLLTVSFYVIFTTLPATLVYVLGNAFPDVRPAYPCESDTTTVGGPRDPDEVAWRRYVVYETVRNVVNEICLSHYACNFFFYVVTGREFRATLRRLGPSSEISRGVSAENGAARRSTAVGSEQRVLLARI